MSTIFPWLCIKTQALIKPKFCIEKGILKAHLKDVSLRINQVSLVESELMIFHAHKRKDLYHHPIGGVVENLE
jgi:hypothetical protein